MKMSRGFWRGVITGGLFGAAMGMYLLPHHQEAQRAIMRGTGMAGKRARKMIRGVSRTVSDLMD